MTHWVRRPRRPPPLFRAPDQGVRRCRGQVQRGDGEDLPAITLHGLRHTHVSVLLSSGVPVKTVSARIGHSTPLVTMSVYAHLLAGDDEAAAGTFAQHFAQHNMVPSLLWYQSSITALRSRPARRTCQAGDLLFLGWGRWDSNPHWQDPKSCASAIGLRPRSDHFGRRIRIRQPDQLSWRGLVPCVAARRARWP